MRPASDVEGHFTSQRKGVLPAAAIILLTLIAYLPVLLDGGFIWDDDSYVTENRLLWQEGGLRRIWWPDDPWQVRSENADSLTFLAYWFRPVTPQYYPVVFTTFWWEYQLWGDASRGYHLVNVLIHAANAALLWLMMLRLRVPGGTLAAWLIAAVFALHPVHVESVAWITERKNVLSLLFYLLAALVYFRFDEHAFGAGGEETSWRRSCALYAGALMLFILALLSKSVTCSLPAALILAMLWLRIPITRKRLLLLVPLFMIGFILAMNTALIERELVGAQGPEFAFTFAERTIIATRALLFYGQKLLWPAPLMFIYPRWAVDPSALLQYLPLVFCFAGGAAVLWLWNTRGARGPFVAIAFYAGTVFPALGYFNVYPHIFSFVADHFVYHASIGLIILVVSGAAHLFARPRLLAITGGVALAALGTLTWMQSSVYESAESVYMHTLQRNPNAWMPHNNLSTIRIRQAEAARQRGDIADMRSLAREGQRHADAAIAVRPHNHPSHANRAEALRLLGDYEQALAAIGQARTFAPQWPEYMWQEGRLLHLNGRIEEAVAAHRKAIERVPWQVTFRHDLAAALVALERWEEAAEQFEAILELQPQRYETIVDLGGIYVRLERDADALRLHRHAVAAAKNTTQELSAVVRLVRLLATSPDQSVRNVEHAKALAHQLAEVTGWEEPSTLSVLASVYAEAGEMEQAEEIARRALNLARSRDVDEIIPMLEEQLAEYGTAAQP